MNIWGVELKDLPIWAVGAIVVVIAIAYAVKIGAKFSFTITKDETKNGNGYGLVLREVRSEVARDIIKQYESIIDYHRKMLAGAQAAASVAVRDAAEAKAEARECNKKHDACQADLQHVRDEITVLREVIEGYNQAIIALQDKQELNTRFREASAKP